MWTPTTRQQHSRTATRYQTDLTDAEWRVIAPHLPNPCATGRPREWPMREIVNGIFYVMRAGCAWRLVPSDLPCAWVISVGPSPLLSKKERSPADSRITQRRSSRPSTALLPWSPSTGTGGRHPPETVVPSNRKPRSVHKFVIGGQEFVPGCCARAASGHAAAAPPSSVMNSRRIIRLPRRRERAKLVEFQPDRFCGLEV